VTAAGFDVRIAWRRDDLEIEADAIAFWTRLGLLPQGVDPKARAKELVAAAYAGGRLVAVATATIEWIPALRARFAALRGATDPGYRRRGAMWALTMPVRETLERWALDHPEEKLAGRIGFVEPGKWGDLTRMPVVPVSELMLIGYDEKGRQVRAAWFDHFRFD
jgi:hypothetical protein